jgi:hypothetical protein
MFHLSHSGDTGNIFQFSQVQYWNVRFPYGISAGHNKLSVVNTTVNGVPTAIKG